MNNIRVLWGIDNGSFKEDKWKPLWKRDNLLLEKIYVKYGPEVDAKVTIRNGSKTADLKNRKVLDNFNDQIPELKLVRGTWFRNQFAAGLNIRKNRKYVAFDENISDKLDIWFAELKVSLAKKYCI